jgi:hypothetical protein
MPQKRQTLLTTSGFACPDCDYEVVCKTVKTKEMMKRLHNKKCPKTKEGEGGFGTDEEAMKRADQLRGGRFLNTRGRQLHISN